MAGLVARAVGEADTMLHTSVAQAETASEAQVQHLRRERWLALASVGAEESEVVMMNTTLQPHRSVVTHALGLCRECTA